MIRLLRVMRVVIIVLHGSPAWYVIGHYRHYKNGKTGWVNGYWKGALRETKKSFDEGRQRILETSHLEGEKSL